jgi:hypothetical protein
MVSYTFTCKTRLAAFVIGETCDTVDYQSAEIRDEEMPCRQLCLRDCISLEHLCQVFPDDIYDFDSLLQAPEARMLGNH